MRRIRIFERKELSVMHLSVLREIGRELGVKMPTAIAKDKLVDTIMKIQRGELDPVTPSKRGAPPKIKIDLSEFYETVSDGVYEDKNMYRLRGKERLPWAVADNTVKNPDGTFTVEGVLETHYSGYGFLRVNNYENSAGDVYVSNQNIRKYNLRRGDKVQALAKAVRDGDSAALQDVLSINDLPASAFAERANFDDLVPYYPTVRMRLERPSADNDLAVRCMDLFTPLGFGQRGLIVAPPKTGKTTLLKMIAQSIEFNYPEVKLIVLLIDERPEEVTDIKRSVAAEVVYSTFDENNQHHIRAAELVVSRAKRLVEVGKNVVILMDSITRLARAYNNATEGSGKTLSGGLDPLALEGPKKFFGAARNIEGDDKGSLTILSTVLIDTGSRMDDVIYEEFKGTGNMEIHLSRALSEKRVFPAIDLYRSGTRKEELLLDKKELDVVFKLRKILSERSDSLESLLEMMKKTKDNADFIKKAESWIGLYEKN